MPWGTIGGTEIATARLAESMRPLGITSIMFCRIDSPRVAAFFSQRGFDTAEYDQQSFKGGFSRFARATLRRGREFRRHAADVVACADLEALATVAAAARLHRLPLISHIRNPYEWLTPLQRFWLVGTNELVFCSNDAFRSFGNIAKFGPQIARRIANVVYDVVELDVPAADAEMIGRATAE
ncbi:MAG: glycosyltransferase, partial [Candidatus Eremiobacteraeota bacterium]|nr:glycosyltransferase [Candidatus Eremiobacteraeota bacterium]